MSMYAEYIKERLDHDIIETDCGFATYRFTDEQTCYLMDIYMKTDYRNQGVARDLANMVVEIAKKRGCTKMIGSVVPSAKGSNTSLHVLLAYGMTLDSCTNDFILFRKEI